MAISELGNSKMAYVYRNETVEDNNSIEGN